MKGQVRWGAIAIGAALLLSACGSKAAAHSGSGGSTANQVGTESLSGIGTALDDSRGFTLYHLTTEKNGQVQCTGSCAGVWPPLLVTSGGAPTATAGLTGSLGTIKRPDGSVQVTYNGMPLYTYSGDSGPHQANGQGVQGVWFAVTASGSGGAPGPVSTSPPTPGGYGY
jgi:predicted lipoprotein with Yx(FWY)xxD motif